MALTATKTGAENDVASRLNDNNRNVRKWGTQLLAIADYSTPIPEKFFNEDGTPADFGDAFKVMGYITTDGITNSQDSDTSDTNMVQDIEPVRSDISSKTRTLQVTFGEMNAWVKALAHGLPVSAWPADKDGDWEYEDGELADNPYYRLLILAQDGVGSEARYRVEFAYRAKVSDYGDRTMNREDAEGEDRTFTCFKDPAVNKSYYEGERAPYRSLDALTSLAVTATPADGGQTVAVAGAPAGTHLVYRIGDAAENVQPGDSVATDWTPLPADGKVNGAQGKTITVVAADSSNTALGLGTAVLPAPNPAKPTLGQLTVTAQARVGGQTVTVTPAVENGQQRRYQIAAKAVDVAYDQALPLDGGWKEFPVNGQVTGKANQVITVADCTTNGANARKTGTAVLPAATEPPKPLYHGANDANTAATYTEAVIKTLTPITDANGKACSFNATPDATHNNGDGQYLVFALPSSLGTPKFTTGGFAAPFDKVTTVSVDGTQYDVWVTQNKMTDAVTVDVA